MSSITLAVGARTDIGRARKLNEDAYLVADLDPAGQVPEDGASYALGDRVVVLALSDGMGGHAAGNVASVLTLESMLAYLRANPPSNPEQALKDAAAAANTAVRTEAETGGKHGMGATLTAALVVGGRAYIAEVGDSRAYLVRDGAIRQLTRDQSLVQALVDSGVLTEEGAKTFPQKNVILQAVGPQEQVQAVVTTVDLIAGDQLLLCCDGLSNELSDATLLATLAEPSAVRAATRLVDLANEHGGADNLTAVVARFGAG